jgi:hypothetical protein
VKHKEERTTPYCPTCGQPMIDATLAQVVAYFNTLAEHSDVSDELRERSRAWGEAVFRAATTKLVERSDRHSGRRLLCGSGVRGEQRVHP